LRSRWWRGPGNQIAGAGDHNCGANRYGYYDANGRWVPRTSTAYGYYDPNGRWIDTSGGAYASQGYVAPAYAPDYGRDAAYSDRDRWAGAPLDVRAREDWLDQGIRRRIADGSLDNSAGRRALRELSDIRRIDSDYPRLQWTPQLRADGRHSDPARQSARQHRRPRPGPLLLIGRRRFQEAHPFDRDGVGFFLFRPSGATASGLRPAPGT